MFRRVPRLRLQNQQRLPERLRRPQLSSHANPSAANASANAPLSPFAPGRALRLKRPRTQANA